MHWQAMQFVTSIKEVAPELFYDRSVLEVGSFVVNDSVRELFNTEDYVGLDLCEGPGVDLVVGGDVYARSEKFDVVISCECFEHNPQYLATFENMVRLLKDGGIFILTCATTGRPEHGTSQTDPSLSPGTSSIGSDYYKNLTESDFGNLSFSKIFDSYFFYQNNSSFDLYFVGIKRSNETPRITRDTLLKVREKAEIFEQISFSIEDSTDLYFEYDFLQESLICPLMLDTLVMKSAGQLPLEKMLRKAESMAVSWSKSSRLYLVLAELYYRSGKVWAALDAIKIYLNAHPDANRGWFVAGNCYEAAGLFDKCIQSWERVHDGSHAGLNFRMAQVYERLFDFDSAYRYFESAVQLQPKNPVFLYRFFSVALKLGRLSEFPVELKSIFYEEETPQWILKNVFKDFKGMDGAWFEEKKSEINKIHSNLIP